MENLFDSEDTEQSDYMDAKFGTQSSLLEDITGGAIATVADFGASVYNSLPGTEEIAT